MNKKIDEERRRTRRATRWLQRSDFQAIKKQEERGKLSRKPWKIYYVCQLYSGRMQNALLYVSGTFGGGNFCFVASICSRETQSN